MDPLAVSLATYGTALFVDTRSLHYEKIPLPMDEIELVIINSGVAHRNVGGGYKTRRLECENACRLLGVTLLREVTSISQLDILPDVLRRRARHVFHENQRVEKAVAALREGNLEELGRLFNQSHASMRDDYEISIPEIDFLVDTATREPGVLGARLTGGGFGGSVVILATFGKGHEVAKRVVEAYTARFQSPATVMLPSGA
jgi:galactokinase